MFDFCLWTKQIAKLSSQQANLWSPGVFCRRMIAVAGFTHGENGDFGTPCQIDFLATADNRQRIASDSRGRNSSL